ncbi:winged helix-turn-helix domain-containing protein [Sneathia sanguinegens]|uniref:Winged helix-turn-helix domain-containing protein n=1 Tax=Sneathia sanguinegens TaxID=40543 RepID=A0ABT7HHH7_9FUSO|nr:winged helix-turn-helix domain-containing protein [Sneathia sanguinegens]MDK9579967.1 winged helix-turn-helix domain-containing protein [Sneathia sanguinegens]
MKKSIEHLILDSLTIEKIIQEYKNTNTLIEALKDLLNEDVQMLVIEKKDGEKKNNGVIKIHDLFIYPIARKILKKDKEIFLTPKEFDILLFLAKNRGEVFTKEQIYTAVWDEDYLMDDSNIMAFIRKIRKKIEDNPDNPEYILTIWGIGYKFNEK